MILRSGLKGGGNGQAGFSLPGFGAGSPMLLVRLLFFHFELGCSLPRGRVAKVLVVSFVVVEVHPFSDVLTKFSQVCVTVESNFLILQTPP